MASRGQPLPSAAAVRGGPGGLPGCRRSSGVTWLVGSPLAQAVLPPAPSPRALSALGCALHAGASRLELASPRASTPPGSPARHPRAKTHKEPPPPPAGTAACAPLPQHRDAKLVTKTMTT